MSCYKNSENITYTALNVKTAPATEPVTTTECKTFLRLDETGFDTMIAGLIIGCRQAIEKYLGRTLISTVWQAYFEQFPSSEAEIELPYGPYITVDSVKYTDTDGDEQTWSSDEYQTDLKSMFARVKPAYGYSYPSVRDKMNPIVVEYTAGYGTSGSDVPDCIKVALKMCVADVFEHPEAETEAKLKENKTYQRLLAAYKIPYNT